ncbi:MAG: protoporphyrinogen oxidase [Bacteroidales bacterium]|nr:protoporphyrinogen oxidase [Bacteroidales bacterium]MBN2756227.1 protoporphyrinogen oxidase [Bacteroidales bacterium]
MIKKNIVVIGSGLTGLTSAHYFNKANADFIVLEKKDTYGGVIQTVTENGFVFENGPNTGVLGTVEIAELFEEVADECKLELADETSNKRYILKTGKWEAIPSGLIGGIKTPLFTLKDKFRLLLEPFRKKGTNPHETLAELVKRRMGQSFLDYAVDPFILGVYSGDPNYLVPKYALPKLYNLEQDYGSFIGGSIKKGFEKKDDQSKKVTRKVFSAEGGLSNLTKALFKSAGQENFIFNAGNIQISKVDKGYLVKYENNGQISEIQADKIITTTDSFELENLLPFIPKEKMAKITNLKYARVIEIVLGFENWEGIELDGFGGLIPFKENRDVLGFLFLSSFLKNKAPKNGALLTLFVGGTRKDYLNDLSDDEIKKLVEKETKDLMGIKEFNPKLFKIFRYKKAIPQYGVTSGERFDTVEEIEKTNKGLYIGGNHKDGIGMADRAKQGKTLAYNALQYISNSLD